MVVPVEAAVVDADALRDDGVRVPDVVAEDVAVGVGADDDVGVADEEGVVDADGDV